MKNLIIGLLFCIGMVISTSCSKSSIEDICSNMNTLTLDDKESYSKLINNTWKFVCYFNTRDGLTFKDKKEIKNKNAIIYFNSDSSIGLSYYLGFDLPINIIDNFLNIDKTKSKVTDIPAINYHNGEVEEANEFFEEFKHSTCFKLEDDYLYIYSDKLNKGFKLEKE